VSEQVEKQVERASGEATHSYSSVADNLYVLKKSEVSRKSPALAAVSTRPGAGSVHDRKGGGDDTDIARLHAPRSSFFQQQAVGRQKHAILPALEGGALLAAITPLSLSLLSLSLFSPVPCLGRPAGRVADGEQVVE